VKRNPVPVALGLVLVALVAVLAFGQLGLVGGSTAASAGPISTVAAETARPTATPSAIVEGSPSPTPTEAPATPAPPAELADVAIVPVTNFRAVPTSTTTKELKAVLAGTSNRYTALELVDGEADAILAALGVERPADPERLVLAGDATTLAKDLAKNRKRLAFLRADVLARVTVALRVFARLAIDAFLTPARRALRDETRALFTARYAGTAKAASESESASSFAIFVTYPRVSRNGGTPRWRRTLPGPAL